jgi:hypothetical protein
MSEQAIFNKKLLHLMPGYIVFDCKNSTNKGVSKVATSVNAMTA